MQHPEHGKTSQHHDVFLGRSQHQSGEGGRKDAEQHAQQAECQGGGMVPMQLSRRDQQGVGGTGQGWSPIALLRQFSIG